MGWMRMTVYGLALIWGLSGALAQEADQEVGQEAGPGPMTVERLDTLIQAIDPDRERGEVGAVWQLSLAQRQVTVIADAANDRMRILVPIAPETTLSPDILYRMMQANFDSALDARYAIARGIVWAAYVHPLGSLEDAQFASAMAQTVTLALTAGTSYSSGALSFGGGDSDGILQQEILDALRKNGVEL